MLYFISTCRRLSVLPSQRLFSTTTVPLGAQDKSRHVIALPDSSFPRGFLVASAYAGVKASLSGKPPPSASQPELSSNDTGTLSSSSTGPSSSKPDLAVVYSTSLTRCSAAGTFTLNAFKAAPVQVSQQILLRSQGRAKAVVVNSGCANAVTGKKGIEDAWSMCRQVDELALGASGTAAGSDSQTLVMSTGVIGQKLPMSAILPSLASMLPATSASSANAPTASTTTSERSLYNAWHSVARAFMTTDTFPKLRTRTFKLAGREVRMVGIDKGAGMIHPNMAGPSASSFSPPAAAGAGSMGGLHATLLGLFATDAAVSPRSLQKALDHAVSKSFNCISVDGDMSTNDTIIALANGAAFADQARPDSGSLDSAAKAEGIKAREEVDWETHPEDYKAFENELTDMAKEMAQLIVRDGEGAEKFVEVHVKGAPTYPIAHSIASTISTSMLTKCALHGGDANWGRILCATGYAPLPSDSNPLSQPYAIDTTAVSVSFIPSASFSEKEGQEPLVLLKNGEPVQVDEEKAARMLAEEDVKIEVDLGEKDGEQATYWTCDLSHEYVSLVRITYQDGRIIKMPLQRSS